MSQLTVNDHPLVMAMPATVLDLLVHIDMVPSKVAVELNGVVVPYDDFDDTDVNWGDSLKITDLAES